ncbi:MAG: energy transducer TonB [Bacteroidia bacterium]|nr:energy transducer TonB [Bacteroidia bacterium]
MDKASLEIRIQEQEKKDLIKAGGITAGVTLLLLLLMSFWIAMRGMIPPPGEKQYIAAGSIDFGDWNEGSQNVNNLEKTVPNPSESAPSQSNPQPVQESSSPPVVTPPNDVISSTAEEEVTTPKQNEVKQETKVTPKEAVKPVTETKTEPKDTKSDSQTDSDKNNPNANTGANDGKSNTPGNKGRPDTQVLDPNGLYSWGEGPGTLNGRIPVLLGEPIYNVQQEAKLTFEFVISPDGTVKYVKPPVTNNPGLKKAGMDAIRKWKFNEVEQSMGDQTSRVTILFKLN